MKLNKTAASLLLMASFSIHASTINYAINVTDSNNDMFVGIADYDSNLDVFTSVNGTLTYADGNVSSSFFAWDQVAYQGYATGSVIGPSAFSVAWADEIIDPNAGRVFILLDSSPSIPTPMLDANAFILDNKGYQYQITSGGITLPEPSSIALLVVGVFGLSRRKLSQ